ncbi:MAG: xanthine dehydrogenase family protein subunit M [Dehalococcoidia bacterium]|nr:xanthine dehydrogenase family protein subunit M [Dehalococcoidia bacterium]
MHGFKYLEPAGVEEACSMLSKHKGKAHILAGGQSLVVLLKTRVARPDYIVNIKNLKELDYIRDDGKSVKIGALTTHRTLETSPLIIERFPVLVEAEHKLAHRQIRNWGTVGGDLCHADPAADISPPLIVLKGKAKALSVRGEREIPLDEFFVDYFATALEEDEILVEIEVPYISPYSAAAYRKETIISGDYPIVSVAAAIGLDKKRETIKEACIVLGAVGTTPIIAKEAGQAITGKIANSEAVEQAGDIASSEAQPTSDILGSEEYKRKLAGVLTKEIVNLAIERARKA